LYIHIYIYIIYIFYSYSLHINDASVPQIILPRVDTTAPIQHIKNVETHALMPRVTVEEIQRIAVKADDTLSGFLLI